MRQNSSMRALRPVLVASLVLAGPGAVAAAQSKPKPRPKAPAAKVSCRAPYVRTVLRDRHHPARTTVVCLAPYPLPPGGF
jgi:hypothetical protein